MTAPLVCTVAPVEAVLRIAQRYPVFPCRRHPEEVIVRGERKLRKQKSPLVERGLHDATQDADRIRAWWRHWPEALVGVPTGKTTGLVVVDYDHDKAAPETKQWIAEHTDSLLQTRSHSTLSGGRHYLFRLPQGAEYKNGVGLRLNGQELPGLDLRGEGGYIIWWPLHGGQSTGELAPLPVGLVDEYRIEHRELAPLPKGSPQEWARQRQQVSEALAYVSPENYETWRNVGMAVHLASGGNDDGFDLWHAWSAGGLTGDAPHNYSGINDCRYHWASYNQDAHRERTKIATLGTVFHLAKEAGWTRRKPDLEPPPVEFPPAEAYEEGAAMEPEEPQNPRANLIDWRSFKGRTPPERKWLIPHWMSDGPMLLSGKGGTGKSSIAQALGTALVLAKPYFAEASDQEISVLGWQCEDDTDEMWRRQIPLLDYFGADFDDIADRLHMEPRRGMDNSLLVPVYGAPTWTPLLKYLREQVNDLRIDVFFLDNIGHVFGCNENARHDVTAFVNGMAGLVTDRPFTVVLMGHTARSQGSEFAGSAAWENAVRMRWWLGHNPPDQPEPEEGLADESVRYLSKRKANYTQRDLVRLTYRNGVFVPDQPQGESFSDRYNAGRQAEEARNSVIFAVRKAAETGTRVVKGKNSPDSLIKWMRNLQIGSTFTDQQILKAVDELVAAGRLKEDCIGHYGNRTKKVGLVAI